MRTLVALTLGMLLVWSSDWTAARKNPSVPAVLMAGSSKSVQIFDTLNPATAGYPAWTTLPRSAPPCDRRQADRMFGPLLKELLDEKAKRDKGKPMTFGIPQFDAPKDMVEKYIKRHCRLGKGTPIAAHGSGWVKKLKLQNFSAKLSPFSFGQGVYLSISAATNLTKRPFFYTTVVPPGDKNQFQAALDMRLPSNQVPEAQKRAIRDSLPQQAVTDGSGDMRFYRYGQGDLLVRVERDGERGTNPKYLARWYDYLVLRAGGKKALVVFRGDSDFVRESGQMELQGVLDMDGDGDLDVLLRGAQCIVLARRTKKGFDSFRLSNLF